MVGYDVEIEKCAFTREDGAFGSDSRDYVVQRVGWDGSVRVVRVIGGNRDGRGGRNLVLRRVAGLGGRRYGERRRNNIEEGRS